MSVSTQGWANERASGWPHLFDLLAGVPAGLLRRLASWQARRQACDRLRCWTDAELKDIGLTRGDIAFAVGRDRIGRSADDWPIR